MSQKEPFGAVRDPKSRTKSRTARHRLSCRSSGDKEVGQHEGRRAIRWSAGGSLAFRRRIAGTAHFQQNTAMELKPINAPPAPPAPHPICLLIPSADEDELQDLTDDIRAHGLISPIVLFEGMILDGRNRAAACERAGIASRRATRHSTAAVKTH